MRSTWFLALLCLFSFLSVAAEGGEHKQNVLFISLDDLRPAIGA